MECRDIELPENAIKYIRSILGDGLSMSQSILRQFVHTSGKARTRVPDYVDAEHICRLTEVEYRYGGVLDYRDGRKCITSFVRKVLANNADYICLFESAVAESTDPWLSRARSHYLAFEKELYFLSTKEDANDVDSALLDAESAWMVVGAIVSSTDPNRWVNKDSLSLDDFQSLAKNVQYVIVNAFDGEGYLIWEL